MTTTRIAPDHLDAIRDVAKAYGYTAIYDSGPCDGRLVIFGDDEFAAEYLHGIAYLGKEVRVHFTGWGTVQRAELRIDNALIQDDTVLPDHGSAGERLVWTAKIFIENPARTETRGIESRACGH